MRMTAAASSLRPPQKLTSPPSRPGVAPGVRPCWRRGRGDVTTRLERDAGAGTPPSGRAAEPAGALVSGAPVSGGAAPGPAVPGDGVPGVAVSGAAAGACPAPGSQSIGSTE